MTFLTRFCSAVVAALMPLAAVLADPAIVMAPGGAGGGYDAAARVPLQVMQETGIFTDGSQVTNKGGAGGTIGLAEFVRTAKGNDNAIMSIGSILVGAIILNKSPVSLDDVTPLVRLTDDAGAVAVPADSPFKTVKDLTAALAKNPGATPVGGGSIGGVDHVTAALLAKAAGLDPRKINYVPYTGGAEMITALAGGQLKAAISGLSELKPYADQGRLRIIAVTSEQRLPGVDAPTLKESGLDVVIGNWRGIVGAPGMSDKGRKMWLDRFAKMHDTPEWKKALSDHEWTDAYLAGDDFAAFLDQEKVRQTEVLKSVGLVK
ncbi:tripartite tricarboxylate transporter substrate binding protein [Allopusillimonas soli]|uniref:Tripartite tricarboxylate transporter substrate binding protein n=1 Tax=Allopusillimonas soli TaxID=659016 RepID=A0A853FKE2_9BURK|nr:tripartite tricarboxylate transporter substrate-binding protein [Allopusillimonas soli]NYT38841.1 tripartite tricarboxylate transporter substrate binding protein [Allopusillimonas soli]TEA70186.1 tripartite tricarboxylate transporter substrate binding protein [Allopusillimonas soli]